MEGNSSRGQGSRGTVAPVVVAVEEKEDLRTFLGGLNKTTIKLNQGICCSGRALTPAAPEYKLEALPHERKKKNIYITFSEYWLRHSLAQSSVSGIREIRDSLEHWNYVPDYAAACP